MPHAVDVAQGDGSRMDRFIVRHENPVTQAGFMMIPNTVALNPDLTPLAKLVYGYLKHLAWRNGSDDTAEPAQAVMAGDLGVSENTLRAAMKSLADAGLLRGKRRGLGQPNLYLLRDPQSGTSDSEVQPSNSEVQEELDLRFLARAGSSSESKTSSPRESPSTAQVRDQVRIGWLTAPGMIQHRPEYFADAKVRAKIDVAVKKYGADDVCRAIALYAEVVASPDHMWNHRWTFGDFLQRGLDRFVPEAEPLDVYRTGRERTIGSNGTSGSTYAGDLSRFDDD